MKHKLLKLLFLFAVLAFSIGGFSESSPSGGTQSIHWQKYKLENSLRDKLSNLLLSFVPENQFFVDVNIVVSDPTEPDFKQDPDSKDEDQKAIEAKKAKKKKKNILVKFVDEYPEVSPEDFIVFNKFGIEAPLVDDFNDLQPDGKILLHLDTDKEDEKKKNEEKKNAKKDSTLGQQAWRIEQAKDIFGNLKSVDFIIKLPIFLDTNKRSLIEKNIKTVNLNLNKVVPTFKFEYVAFGTSEKSTSEILGNIIDTIAKFSSVIAVVLGMILLMLVGNALIKKYFEMNTENGQSGNFKMEGADSDENDAEELADGAGGGGGDDSIVGAATLNGVERFIEYFKTNSDVAVLLIKKWLKDDNSKSISSLRTLVQQMDNTDLTKIFDFLNEGERALWKKHLDTPLRQEELAIANDYLGNQIVQSIIVPNYIDDPETFDLLLKLSTKDVVKILENEQDVAGLLLNSLSPQFVSTVLNECHEELRSKVVTQAMSTSLDEIKEKQIEIKTVLQKYTSIPEIKPFSEKLVELIPHASPRSEGELFRALVKDRSDQSTFELLFKYFPSELISELPEMFLKEVLNSYKMEDKVKLLFTLDTEVKEHFMNVFAPEGSKVNDLLNLEFENILKDEVEKKRIERDAAQHWKSFVDYTRKTISKEKKFKGEVEDQLHAWMSGVCHTETDSPVSLVA